VVKLATIKPDISQIPVTETAQSDQIGLILAPSNDRADPVVKYAAKRGKEKSNRPANCGGCSGIAWYNV
jgi:hypothetical protein